MPAGRPKGSPNKSKILRVEDILHKLGVNPVEELMKIIDDLAPKDQARVWLELQSYCQAKPRELEPTEDEDDEDLTNVPKEKLLELIRNGG